MKTTELAFFAVAILLPLVGGSLLLYFLSRGSKDGESARSEDRSEPKEK